MGKIYRFSEKHHYGGLSLMNLYTCTDHLQWNLFQESEKKTFFPSEEIYLT